MHSLVKELMTLRADADLASDVRQQVLRRAMAIDPDKVAVERSSLPIEVRRGG
jgi:hypothetical protein